MTTHLRFSSYARPSRIWVARILAMLCLLTTAEAFAATYTVPSPTSYSIQATINTAYAAGSNNTVLLPAGGYTISSPISVPCNNGLTITGPVASPATAVLNAAFTNQAIFVASGSCTGITVEYLQFRNTGGMYFGSANHSGILITHNQFFNLPSSLGGTSAAETAIYMDGNLNTTSTFTITYNTFGDSTSCTAVFATAADEGGYCAGIFVSSGISLNHVIKYNLFNHTEEGLHYHQICSGCGTGTNVSVAENLQIEYNYFYNWHRIAIEIQTAVASVGQNVSHNALVNPLNPSFGTMFISDACCVSGRTYLNSASADISNTTNDNVMIADNAHVQQVGQFFAPVVGIEYWGGPHSTADWNYAGGAWSDMIDWGYNHPVLYIRNNYLCQAHGGTYLNNEENLPAMYYPTTANNTTVAVCQPTVTATPTINQSASAVSITDAGKPGVTPGGQPVSIFYTTDGSTPTVNSNLYTGPFSPAKGTVVKAIGMFGVAPMPMSYPAGYGYVPSAVASATYNGTGTSLPAPVTLSSVTVSGTGGQQSLLQGTSLQMTAACTYSDGSTTSCNTADAHGNAVSAWTSSNSAAVTVSAGGVATAVTSGSAAITATVAGITASPDTLTVAAPVISLQSISINNAGGVHSLSRGGSVQMTATCGYTDGSATLCNSADSHGNAVTAWTSSSPTIATIGANGMVNAVAAGSTQLTAAVGGMTATAWPVTVTVPALTSVTLATTGGATTLAAGSVNQLIATCQYTDGSTTNCTTADANGNAANPWVSSAPNVAAVTATGALTAMAPGATNVTATVTPSSAPTQWGSVKEDLLGYTYPGFINATYTVLGSQAGGYMGQTCSFYLPPATLTVGSKYDCGLIPAPTPTTQGSAWQCQYTYTVTNASWPGGWITGQMSDCGTLAAGSAWWVAVVTNQPGQSPAGFYDCATGCSGTAPTNGTGTYGYRWVADAYGVRTNLTPTLNTGGARQAAQYVTLGQPSVLSNALALAVSQPLPPSQPAASISLTSIFLTTVGNADTIAAGRTLQLYAWGVYTDGTVQRLPDNMGNTINLWNTTNHAVARVSTLGHVTAIKAGTVNVMAYVGSIMSAPTTVTVTPAPTANKSASTGSEEGGVAAPEGAGAPKADPFAGPLWGLTAPVGGSASISQNHLFLGVPGASNHDTSSGQDNAVRVLQPIGDESFDVSMRIDSSIAAKDAGTQQGLLVEGDDHNFIAFSLDCDGARIALNLRTVTNGETAAVLQNNDFAAYQTPMYLRLTRTQSGYVAFYSADGQNWIQAISFHSTITPSGIGPFAANHSDTPSDATPVVMSVGTFDAR